MHNRIINHKNHSIRIKPHANITLPKISPPSRPDFAAPHIARLALSENRRASSGALLKIHASSESKRSLFSVRLHICSRTYIYTHCTYALPRNAVKRSARLHLYIYAKCSMGIGSRVGGPLPSSKVQLAWSFFFFFYSSRFVDSPMNCVGAIGDANNTVHAYAVWLLTNPAKI